MPILPPKKSKKNLSQKDLSKLRNDGEKDIPMLPTKRAVKAVRAKDYDEADALFRFIRDGDRDSDKL
jgi:hypothetical protein